MKTKFLPLIFIICVQFISCKKKHENSCIPSYTACEKFVNKLELKDGKIYADLHLPVASSKFHSDPNPELFEEGNFKGLAYRYSDENTNLDGNEECMHVHLVFNNIYDWKEDSNVRIMPLHENDDREFRNLRPYFKERVRSFEDKCPIELEELKKFNETWNAHNPPNLAVTTSELSETLHYQNKVLTPKLTKQDMIIKLTKK